MTARLASWYANRGARSWRSAPATTDGVVAFHRALPGYAPTRLVDLPTIAHELGVARVVVKEEAGRWGLPAFKILGASWAIARALSRHVAADAVLSLDRLRARLPDAAPLELVAATDGNHGRAVARVAALLGIPAYVYVPTGVSADARAAIVAEGAMLQEIDAAYDDVVALAAQVADRPGRLLIQDTAWPGYGEIPQWIVDGYTTLCAETDARLAASGETADVVVVPAGVGSLAQAVVIHYRRPGSHAPAVLAVEPEAAPCVLAALHAGRPLSVPTTTTIMTGLTCGTMSAAAWPVLSAGLDAAVTITDSTARAGIRDLATQGVDAGPCGAASLAAARAALTDPERRQVLGVDDSSTVVLLSTEGRAANPIADSAHAEPSPDRLPSPS